MRVYVIVDLFFEVYVKKIINRLVDSGYILSPRKTPLNFVHPSALRATLKRPKA